MSAHRDRRLAQHLESWFERAARDLPWRSQAGTGMSASGRNPYVALTSELMLQQTQVARVVEKLPVFLARFPDVFALARAPEQEVLAAWSGLGYYRRARLLHAAARAIVDQHDGIVPDDVEWLRALPGVGRYTAGALASLVFNQREPAVDGNVERVLVRIEGRTIDESPARRLAWAWSRAGEIVGVCDEPAALNEGLIELGAIVCTSRAPRCGDCPVRRSCRARLDGTEREIPRPKPTVHRRIVHHNAVLVRDSRCRRLVEQRPSRGLWAGMWQAPTLETQGRPASRARLIRDLGVSDLERFDEFDHLTSHRLVRFAIWRGELSRPSCSRVGRFVTRRELAALPLANPQRRILDARI